MMKKLKIGKILFAAAAAAAAFIIYLKEKPAVPDHKGQNPVQEQLVQNDNSSERYIDWNCPSIGSARTEVLTERSQNGPSVPRGQNSVKNLCRECGPANMAAGPSALSRYGFMRRMALFPSGAESDDHHLIILRKLLI